jgi:hypothetical protein
MDSWSSYDPGIDAFVGSHYGIPQELEIEDSLGVEWLESVSTTTVPTGRSSDGVLDAMEIDSQALSDTLLASSNMQAATFYESENLVAAQVSEATVQPCYKFEYTTLNTRKSFLREDQLHPQPHSSDGGSVSCTGPKPKPAERFQCTVHGCLTICKRSADLRRHHKVVHSPSLLPQCTFPGCDNPFVRPDKLRDHQRKHDAQLKIEKGDEPSKTIQLAVNAPFSDSLVEYLGSLSPHSEPFLPQEGDAFKQEIPSGHNHRDLSPSVTEESCSQHGEISTTPNIPSRNGSISTRAESPHKSVQQKRQRQPPTKSQTPDHGEQIRFACPFHKHDPHTYNIRNYRLCALSGWPTIARVK